MESHSNPSKSFFDATQRNHFIFSLRNVFILANNNYNVVHEMVHYIILGGGKEGCVKVFLYHFVL